MVTKIKKEELFLGSCQMTLHSASREKNKNKYIGFRLYNGASSVIGYVNNNQFKNRKIENKSKSLVLT